MKWKNQAEETSIYFVTGTLAGWRPLFEHQEARRLLFTDLRFYLDKYQAYLVAWVVMPEHYHLVVALSQPSDLHGWLKGVQGHSARELRALLAQKGQTTLGPIWKEQARAVGITSDK